MTCINLVSGPRNISTALMYSFAQRSDTTVLDEPFYAVYLLKSGANHPGKQEVMDALPAKEEDVRNQIKQTSGKDVLFVKNMAHHMEVLSDPFIEGAINIFLIRNPFNIIASYSQVIDKPVMRDIGIAYQFHLFKHLTDRGERPIVVDSGLLLENPPVVLRKLCESCNIPFEERMLSWNAGPKPYDGVWAKHWYNNVHQSRGFEAQMTPARTLDQGLLPLYAECRIIYEKLLPFSLKA